MNPHLRRLAAIAVALATVKCINTQPSTLSASIINTTGDVRQFAPPGSVLNNAWQSDRNIRVFREQNNLTLQSSLAVDILGTGTFEQSNQFTPGSLAAGSHLESYLIHQDGKSGNGRLVLKGSVTFDQNIVGVIVNRYRLNASDLLVGRPQTAYGTNENLARGLEFGAGLDWVKISANRKTISFRLVTSVPLDQIRVLTAIPPVPSPGSAALLIGGVCTAFGRRRKR